MKTHLTAILVLALTACASNSPPIDPARVSELRKGQTTVAEVTQRFGRPSILSKNMDGTQTAIYMRGPSGAANPDTFSFDANGVLTDYKIRQVDAAAVSNTAQPMQADANKSSPMPANTNKSSSNTTSSPAPTSSNSAAPARDGGWLDILIPSETKDNR